MMDSRADDLSSIQADDNQPLNQSGCELLIASGDNSNAHGNTPLQNIRRAYQEASAYFSIEYLDSRRGYGAIAKTDIPMHTLILDEPPLLPCDALQMALEEHESGLLTCHDDDSRYLRCYFEKLYEPLDLDDEMKEMEVQTLIDLFWCMHDQYASNADDSDSPDPTKGIQKRIRGINYSNAFFNAESTSSAPITTENQPTAMTNASFRTTLHFLAAKLNHSCKPNVGYDFNQNNQRMFTTRDIKRGEELCDCYSDVVYHEPSWVRRIFLKEKYSFDCRCVACTMSTAQQEESDERRMHLKEIAKLLSARVGASFLYNQQFDREVQCVANDDGEGESPEDEYQHGNWTGNVPNASKLRPTADDLYNLLEYIDILNKEGINHDIVECMELAFDLAVFLNDKDTLQHKHLGQSVLTLYQVTKGEKHRKTRQFRKRLVKIDTSLR